MFGPLGRGGGPQARRSRRRLALATVIVIVIGVIAGEIIDQLVNSENRVNKRSDSSYVAAVVPIVAQSNALIPLLGEIRSAPSNLPAKNPRSALDVRLNELTSGAAGTKSALARLGLVAPNTRAQRFINEVFAARLQAATQIDGAVSLSTGSGRTAATERRAGVLLTHVAAVLAQSDHDYRAFIKSLPDGSHAAALPTSAWYRPSQWRADTLAGYVQTLATASALATHGAIKIVAIALQPPAVKIVGLVSPTTTTSTTTTTTLPFVSGVSGVSPGSTTTTTPFSTTTTFVTTTTDQIPPYGTVSNLPATANVQVTVVIANAGTEVLHDIAVTANLRATKIATKKVPVGPTTADMDVNELSPGGARYLVLARLRVQSGATYVLSVRAEARNAAPTRDAIKIAIGR